MSAAARLGAAGRRARAIVLLALCGCYLSPAAGQSPADLQYRRVLTPQDELASQIRGLLPLRRDEFERRLRAAGIAGAGAANPAAVRLDSVRLVARLEANQLRGTADFEIVAAGHEPVLLDLEPCNVALSSAAWTRPQAAAAMLGVDPDGALRCFVPQSGTLHCQWSAPSAESEPGQTQFVLRLPSAPRRTLEITAPENVEWSVAAGIVSGPSSADSTGFRRWTIELSGGPEARLIARRAEALPKASGSLAVRENSIYTVLPSAIDLQASLGIDLPPLPAAPLELIAAAGLHVTAVELDGERIPFSSHEIAESRATAIGIELPAGIAGQSRNLQIIATADWPLENRATLPRIAVAGGVLQDGKLTVAAPAWLRLQARPLAGCIMTAAISASGGRANDQFQFQIFDAGSSIEITSDQAPPSLHEESGAQFTFEAAQVKGVLVANLSTLAGDRFVLEATIPRQWIVDSVEMDPPEALADRSFAPRGQNQQVLQLSLARPLVSARPLQLILRAHARRPANGQPLTEDFFTLAKFAGVREMRRLVAVDFAEPGAELILAKTEGVARLDPEQLSAPDLELFESHPRTLVAELTDANRALRGALAAATARYRADVVVRAVAEAGRWRQQIHARCHPEGTPVNSVLVRVAPRPAQPVSWSVVGAEQEAAVATEVPLAEAGGGGPAAAVYRLTLPRSRSTPFDLLGEWTVDSPPEGDVSLAWLPEAGAQTGVVELHVLADDQLLLTAEELQALPIVTMPGDTFTPLRARYRYESSRGARLRMQPAPAAATQRGAWIKDLQLSSYFAAAGHSQHEAVLHVVNAGLHHLHIAFDRDVADLRLVEESGHEQKLSAATRAGDFRIPLPAGVRAVALRLRYSAAIPSGQTWLLSDFVAPVPQTDLPILARSWTVALPPGWQPAHPRRFAVPSEPIERSNQSAAWRGVRSLIAGPAWGRQLFAAESPAEPNPASDSNFAGWTFINAELPDESTASMGAYHPTLLAAWSLCLAAAVAAIATLLPVRRHWLLSAAVVGFAAALVMPQPFAGLLLGIGGGLLLGVLWLLIRPRPVVDSLQLPRSVPASTLLGHAAQAVGLMLLIAGPAAALLAAPGDSPTPLAAPRPRVIVPVDDEQQPTGDYVYLEPAFYEALHRWTDTRPAALAPWLLEQARYEFPTPARVEGSAAVVDELRAVYEFHTLLADTTLRLPLVRGQVVLREGLARLDGRPVTLDWQPAGDALTLPIETPGRHRLELSLGAIARHSPTGIFLELSLPRAAQTLVTRPAGNGEVAAPATVPGSTDAGPLVLPSCDRLSVRWPAPHQSASAAGGLLADQLLWWKVRPGSVVLEGLFRLQPLGGEVREANIVVDPRLRLLPGALAAGRIATVDDGSQHLVNVQFTEPAAGPINLRLSWLWPEVSGLGNLPLPPVHVQADRIDRRWIAISGDSGLSIERPAAVKPVVAAEFLQAWGEVASPPAFAFEEQSGSTATTIAVRPEMLLPRVEQSIEWSLASTIATAYVNLRLHQVPPNRLEHRLTIPPQLKATSVTLTQNGQVAPLRWMQQSDGALLVTLFEPAAAEQELNVTAELPLPRQRPRLSLAEIRLQEAAFDASTMRIYRHGDVAVALQSPAGWTELDAEANGAYRTGRGRLVATLRNEAAIGNTQPVIARQPNQPQVSGSAFIRAHEADGDWRGEVELDLNVAGGVLDELRLELPDQWAGPLQVEPPLEHRYENLPGQRQRLLIRPPQAITGPFQLSIRGPLASGDAGLTAPDVSLLDAPAVDRLVLLDRGHAGQRIDWETTGLIAVERSTVLLPSRWHGLEGELLRAVAPRFDATAHPRLETTATPRVHLAVISMHLAARAQAKTVAKYVIRPAGARSLRCMLPAESRLIQVLVDGVAVNAISSGPRTWIIATPSTSLPFELTVVSDGTLTEQRALSAPRQLAAPHLVNVQVDHTIWEVDVEDRGVQVLAAAAAARGTAGEAAVLRFAAASHALEDVAAAATGNMLHSVLAENANRWRFAYEQALAQAPPVPAGGNDVPAERSARHATAIERATRARQRLTAAGHIVPEPASGASPAESPSPAPTPALRIIATGPAEELTVTLHDPAANRALVIKACALLLIGLAIFIGPALRWGPCRDWLAANAHLLLALAGLAWWLIAPFGWLGWLPVLAALWLSLRFPQSGRRVDLTWTAPPLSEPTR